MRHLVASLLLLAGAVPLAAQDTLNTVDGGARVILKYAPGARPRLVVLPGTGMDSARTMVRRDLDFSDRFEMVGDFSATAGTDAAPSGALNYGIYKTLGAQLGVEIAAGAAGVTARLHDINLQKVRTEQNFTLPAETDPNYRLEVHRMADVIARWASGTLGIAATRFLYVSEGRIHQIDSDGANARPLTQQGVTALSPVWSPDGQRFAYTRFESGRGPLIVQSLSDGSTLVVPGAQTALNITPAFAPDNRTLAFAHSDESGTDIFTANVVDRCCTQRLTVGRYSDNLSPTYSSDGRRIAFISTRAGLPKLYAMAADGTDQEVLAPFDAGATGGANAPEWSPDGSKVAYHRDISRNPQIFMVDASGTRLPAQLTSQGRNEDPTWAPDGRHIAFISERSGRRQIWIMDTETGRARQLQTPGAARLPSWSRRLGQATVATNP